MYIMVSTIFGTIIGFFTGYIYQLILSKNGPNAPHSEAYYYDEALRVMKRQILLGPEVHESAMVGAGVMFVGSIVITIVGSYLRRRDIVKMAGHRGGGNRC